MSAYKLWVGNGDHSDIDDQGVEDDDNPGCVAFFPTEEAKAIAPFGAKFVAVGTSPRPGSDILDGFFCWPSSKPGLEMGSLEFYL